MSLTEFELREILEWTSGRWVNESETSRSAHDLKVRRVAPLESASAGDLAFFFSPELKDALLRAKPSVLLTGEDFVEPLKASGLPLWQQAPIVACREPYLAMARLSERIAVRIKEMEAEAPGVHPQAFVHSDAQLGEGVRVAPGATVDAGAVIGKSVVLHSGARVGRGVVIGDESEIFENVVLYPGVQLGKRVRLHAGVVIGADGFGYAQEIQDGKVARHQKIHHFGGVVIEDDVEIGANSAVDRGTFGNTVVSEGTKIDNLVQVGHNVRIGKLSILCGQVGIAGSAKIGAGVFIGGHSGISHKGQVGDGAKIGPMTGVLKTVRDGEEVMGSPSRPVKEYFRLHALLNRMLKREGKSR